MSKFHNLPVIEKGAIPFDENGFVDWLVDAQTRDSIAYYRGHLGRDRYPGSGILSADTCKRLNAIADRVMVAVEQGLVYPLQVRLGTHDFLYLAVRATGRLGDPLAITPAPRAEAMATAGFFAAMAA